MCGWIPWRKFPKSKFRHGLWRRLFDEEAFPLRFSSRLTFWEPPPSTSDSVYLLLVAELLLPLLGPLVYLGLSTTPQHTLGGWENNSGKRVGRVIVDFFSTMAPSTPFGNRGEYVREFQSVLWLPSSGGFWKDVGCCDAALGWSPVSSVLRCH